MYRGKLQLGAPSKGKKKVNIGLGILAANGATKKSGVDPAETGLMLTVK